MVCRPDSQILKFLYCTVLTCTNSWYQYTTLHWLGRSTDTASERPERTRWKQRLRHFLYCCVSYHVITRQRVISTCRTVAWCHLRMRCVALRHTYVHGHEGKRFHSSVARRMRQNAPSGVAQRCLERANPSQYCGKHFTQYTVNYWSYMVIWIVLMYVWLTKVNLITFHSLVYMKTRKVLLTVMKIRMKTLEDGQL
jgi:hypothetical protein